MPLQIKRAHLARFIELVEFFTAYAGVNDPRLPPEFQRLRPELEKLTDLIKVQL